MNSNDILDTDPSVKGLCALSRDLGYKDPLAQLANSDGTVVGDLLEFLNDNPGACEAVIEWVNKHYGDEDDDVDDLLDEED